MNEQLLERPAAGENAAVGNEPNRNDGGIRVLRTAVPAAFRKQEKFWREVRKRISERNPAVRGVLERLY